VTVGSVRAEVGRSSQDTRRKASNTAKEREREKKVTMKSPDPPKRQVPNPKGQEDVLILVDCLEEEPACC